MMMFKSMNLRTTIGRLMSASAVGLIASAASGDEGFAIVLNGEQIAGDPVVVDQIRATDVALQQADVQVSFDGLGAEPRLALEIDADVGRVAAGNLITLRSEMNYPAYVVRGEVRFIDPARGTVLVAPIDSNGSARIAVPEGDELAVVLRVYDDQGRYDETAPVPLAASGGPEGVEEGNSQIARQRIPVFGGAVTVVGQDVAQAAQVTVMGERVATDREGGFVLQRILPAGTYGVDVRVSGGGQQLALERQLEIPASEVFYVATVDLTYGIRRVDNSDWEGFDSGRVAFFVDGRTADGWRITASADSGEGEIRDIFRRFDDRDPRELLLRIDPDDLYPTYGDDSTIEDRTPTSGNLFLRVERDGNFLQWGDFAAELSSDGYVRNQRTLYGLSGFWATQDQTNEGEPRAQIYAYAAQPEQLPQRDVFLGTGGSVYFLDQQDIARATETISIQTRDASTGRVLTSRILTAGVDYQINYIQGIITLARPLQSEGDDGLIIGARDTDNVLVAQYEYTPQLSDVDGFSYGARVEGWVTDDLRIGVSGLTEETGDADQSLVGADILWQLSERTFARLEYARSEGPGFGSTFSADGGLIFDTSPLAAGTGEALRFEAQADLVEMGLGTDGTVGFYFEDREEGFSTLDVQVTDATGDETFWGVSADFALGARTRVTLAYDDYDTEVGDFERTATLEVAAELSEQLTVTAGLESQDILLDDEDGNRLDAAVRLDYALSESASVYGYVQGTLEEQGLGRNDRAGLGGTLAFENGWEVGAEVSDGTDGAGGRILASYSDGQGNTRYAGFELDPSREISGVDLRGRDQGQWVAGGREQVSDSIAMFGENTYDAFGDYRSLTSAYGLTFTPNTALTTTIAMEFGRIEDDRDNDFDRQAVSIGMGYETEAVEAAARVEYRIEEGLRSGADVETDTLLVTTDLAYRLDDDQRLLFSADLARTETDDSAILDGDYSDIIFGYAYRPAEAGRLNVLARYRYLMDEFGQRLDGTDERGPLQRSQVASVDLSYALNHNWTLGGKLGYRMSQTAAEEGDPFTQNDAWLAVANARFHLVNEWDALIEVRRFDLVQGDTRDIGVLAAGYRQMNENVSLGIGYNFGRFSDDLTDMVMDDEGLFLNLVANY